MQCQAMGRSGSSLPSPPACPPCSGPAGLTKLTDGGEEPTHHQLADATLKHESTRGAPSSRGGGWLKDDLPRRRTALHVGMHKRRATISSKTYAGSGGGRYSWLGEQSGLGRALGECPPRSRLSWLSSPRGRATREPCTHAYRWLKRDGDELPPCLRTDGIGRYPSSVHARHEANGNDGHVRWQLVRLFPPRQWPSCRCPVALCGRRREKHGLHSLVKTNGAEENEVHLVGARQVMMTLARWTRPLEQRRGKPTAGVQSQGDWRLSSLLLDRGLGCPSTSS